METIANKVELTKELITVYNQHAIDNGSMSGVRAVNNRVHWMHNDYAYNKLAEAVATRTEAWDDLVLHANESAKLAATALALCGPNAQKQVADVEISPITLRVGESKTYTGMHSKVQLTKTLQSEPELVASLKRSGDVLTIMDQIKALIEDTPEYVMKEIFNMATNPKFAASHQKVTVLRDGERVTLKANAARDLNAVISGGAAYKVIGGINKILPAGLKLIHMWAERGMFWDEIPPARQPSAEQMAQEEQSGAYPGGDAWTASSPLKDYEVAGRTSYDQWADKERIKREVAEDYFTAAEEVEEFINKLDALLPRNGTEWIYAWKVIDAGAGKFEPITNRAEAEDVIVARSIAYKEHRAAEAIGLTEEAVEQLGLVDAVLEDFTPEERDALNALRKELGYA